MRAGDAAVRRKKLRHERMFVGGCYLLIATLSLVLLTFLVEIFRNGITRVNWAFVTSSPSRFPEEAGMVVSLVGSLLLVTLVLAIAFPIGVGAAVYLEEYGSRLFRGSRILWLIDLNWANLATVPPIVYGLMGLALFVRTLALGESLLSGALTLAMLVLPMIVISSREALRAVPNSVREASLALGATRWQTVFHHVLPTALPGIITGTILALLRAVGETVPLIMVGALAYVAFLPDSVLSPYSALPVQIFSWITRPQAGFHQNAAAAIVLFLPVLLVLNFLAIWLRNRYEGRR